MTSRVSFVKLYKETLQHHLASLLITVFVFVVHLIAFFLNLQNIISADWISSVRDTEYMIEEITQMCTPNLTNGILAVLMAIYLAYDYFRYMHSKRETDFYESLPVARKEWFKTLFVCCFSIFSILCTITIGIELAMVFGFGFGSFVILQNMLWNLLCMIGIFLATWVTAALAMIMTGHSIVALMGFGVFSSYAPLLLQYLIPAYAATFFDTYVGLRSESFLNYFSPISLAYKLTRDYNYLWNISEHSGYFVGVWIFALVVGVIAYLLFLRRPSEAAGRAMAFEKSNSAIRMLLVIPFALYIGLFLRSMSVFASDAWHIFGILFGAFIIHGLMECIFQFDIRALFSKKKQFLITLLICYGFAFIFWADVFHYDEYVPQQNEVEAVYISDNSFDYFSVYGEWDDSKDGIRGEYLDEALTIAKELSTAPPVNENAGYLTFAYQLKNGTTKYRNYNYDVTNISETFDRLFATEEYKNDICPLYTTNRDEYTAILYTNGISDHVLELTDAKRDELLDTYLEEYTALTLSQHYLEPVLLQIGFQQAGDENESYKHYNTEYFSVYANFEKTLDLLKQYGAQTLYEAEDVKLISIDFYDEKDGHQEIAFTDYPQLRDWQNHMMLCEFNHSLYSDDWIYCTLKAMTSDGECYFDVFVKKSFLETITP